jgi:acyl transferase domain-containing protein/acyl carrier protein
MSIITEFAVFTFAGQRLNSAHLTAQSEEVGTVAGDPIALIGMDCRFPGARNIQEFWRNLVDGVESISRFDDEELRAAGISEKDLRDPNYVRAAPVITDIDMFDSAFFGISPREAEVLDPQHRIFLETCYAALQMAGYDPSSYPGRIGVFAGCRNNEYLRNNVVTNPEIMRAVGDMVATISNETDYLATGVAYRLNLHGPAISTVTACSTSLVGVHLACQAVRNGECELAIAGGVEIPVPMIRGYFYNEGGINSPDGQVRPFDANARGTVFGSGCGAVILKRLDSALADGDVIHAVLLGTAINNDGSDKSVFSAPSKSGQVAVIDAALRDSAVSPDSIGFVEAHGTGTIVGDPIEVAALTEAYRRHTSRTGYCAIASVKGNVGHLGAAAGICGLIKAARCVDEGILPASLNFEETNPAIDIESSPFYINTSLALWRNEEGPRRAGVSAFGVGGTNAHVIIGEPPPRERPGRARRPYQLLTISARTPEALNAATAQLAEAMPEELADAAYTLNVGRPALASRRFVVARDEAGAAAQLAGAAERAALSTERAAITILPPGAERRTAFLFPGQGAQYLGMARGLYTAEPVFAARIDRCASVLRDSHGLDLADVLFRGTGGDRLGQTVNTQPALFAVEYALATLLTDWGIVPSALAGHSIGEYVAACLAGVIDPDDAVRLVAERGALMQALPGGAMLAVTLPEELLLPMLPEGLDVAAVNAPGLCVVSGPDAEVEEFRRALTRQGVGTYPLRTSHAFHSRMMDPVLDAFGERVGKVKLSPPKLPYVSNLTGTWITAEEATDPAYWCRHLRNCVRFSQTLQTITQAGGHVFAEVGPGQAMTRLVGAMDTPRPAPQQKAAAVPMMRKADEPGDDVEVLLEAIGGLWSSGAPIDWERFWSGEKRQRITLPAYPFERRRFWIERNTEELSGPADQGDDIGPFYLPAWRETAPAIPELDAIGAGKTAWVVFAAPGDPSMSGLTRRLREAGARLLVAEPGESFAERDGQYVLREDDPAGYARLFADAMAGEPDRIRLVHAWTAGGPRPERADAARAHATVSRGFLSALTALQAVARSSSGVPVEMCIITSDAQDVSGDGQIEPAKSAVLGLVKLVHKEFAEASCRSVDIPSDAPAERVGGQLFAELTASTRAEQVAYRGRKRWEWGYCSVLPEAADKIPAVLKEGGVYIITGGLGGIGAALAEQLGGLLRAKLILLSRGGLPDRAGWPALLESAGADDATARRVRAVEAIEAAGGEVLVCAASVLDEAQLRSVQATIEETFGPVDGIFHLAAVAGGGMLEARPREAAEQVLAPKVEGTYVLDHVFHPDLFVLYSSISVVTGDFGLGDYIGANGVMDAFAQAEWAKGRHVVSIDWPPWTGAGMAVDSHAPSVFNDLALGRSTPSAHPLLRARRGEGDDVVSFDIELDPELWVLSEHRMEGTPTMPTTGIIELVRAAYEEVTGSPTAEIRDLMVPAMLLAESGVQARAELRRTGGDDFTFAVEGGKPSQPTQTYARGRVGPAPADPVAHRDLVTVREACASDTTPEFEIYSAGMDLGPRWDIIPRRLSGHGLDLVKLELPPAFADDITGFRLHPSLLDAAGTFGMSRPDDGKYLPFSYDRIIVRGALPSSCLSVVHHLDDTRGELTRIDFAVVDDEGAELVTVEGYTLLRVNEDLKSLAVAGTVGEAAARRADPDSASSAGDGTSGWGDASIVSLIRETNAESSVSPAEGAEALRIILAAGLGPQVIVCPGGIPARKRRTDRITRSALMERLSDATTGTGTRSITTPYVAPESDAERTLAQLWQDAIGLDQVGLDDDFIELGGNSLIAVQLIGRISQRFESDISVAMLFEQRTVRRLAAALQNGVVQDAAAQAAGLPDNVPAD